MNKPGEAVLVDGVSVEPFGGDCVVASDINADGQLELLIVQDPRQFKTKRFFEKLDEKPALGFDEIDAALYCLTAVTLSGKVLWQLGKPYDRKGIPYTGHGPHALLLDDVDVDGELEVVLICRKELMVLKAATGEVKNSVELPLDNFHSVCTAQLGPRKKGRQIIARVTGDSYAPFPHGSPTIVYNSDLSVYHGPIEVDNAGHNIVVLDASQNKELPKLAQPNAAQDKVVFTSKNRSKLLIGYSMLDHKCDEIWTVDLPKDISIGHADNINVSDLNDDGKLEVLYSGSEDFFVANLEGNLLWRTKAGHSQSSIAGPWGPNGEKRIIMSEKWRGLWGLDTEGNVLWNRSDINGYATGGVRWHSEGKRTSWAVFEPNLKPIKDVPYESDPSWSQGLWPRFIDGDGTLIDVFPWRDEYAQPKQLIRSFRSYDCGVKFSTVVQDIDGDGLDEVIVYDRRRVWIFHSPES